LGSLKYLKSGRRKEIIPGARFLKRHSMAWGRSLPQGRAGGWRSILEIYKRTKESLLHPEKFFNQVKHERGIKKPFWFFLAVMALTLLFLTYHHMELFNSLIDALILFYNQQGIPIDLPRIELTPKAYIVAYVVLLVSTIITSFLWYYITHLCVRMLGGKHPYDQTYKAMTYSLSADYLALPAFAVSLVSLVIAIGDGSLIAKWVFVISTILYLVPTFYRLWIRLIGLEKLQEISRWRAFLAAYVFAYVLLFLVIFIIDVIIIFLALTLFSGSIP
jgi:hypothetical protein